MEERHQQACQLYVDERYEKARVRHVLRDAVSSRLQTYFITLTAGSPENADALLRRVELQARALNE
jgi:hypothetical protein